MSSWANFKLSRPSSFSSLTEQAEPSWASPANELHLAVHLAESRDLLVSGPIWQKKLAWALDSRHAGHAPASIGVTCPATHRTVWWFESLRLTSRRLPLGSASYVRLRAVGYRLRVVVGRHKRTTQRRHLIPLRFQSPWSDPTARRPWKGKETSDDSHDDGRGHRDIHRRRQDDGHGLR